MQEPPKYSPALEPDLKPSSLINSEVTVIPSSHRIWEKWPMPVSSVTAELRDILNFYRTNVAQYGTVDVCLSFTGRYRGILYNEYHFIVLNTVIEFSQYTPDMVWLSQMMEPLHFRLLSVYGFLHVQLGLEGYPNVLYVTHPDANEQQCSIL